jgi:hypothetical protein
MNFKEAISIVFWAVIFIIYYLGGCFFIGRDFCVFNNFLLLSLAPPYVKWKWIKEHNSVTKKRVNYYLLFSWTSGFFVYLLMWVFNFPKLHDGLMAFDLSHILLQLFIWYWADVYIMKKMKLKLLMA